MSDTTSVSRLKPGLGQVRLAEMQMRGDQHADDLAWSRVKGYGQHGRYAVSFYPRSSGYAVLERKHVSFMFYLPTAR